MYRHRRKHYRRARSRINSELKDLEKEIAVIEDDYLNETYYCGNMIKGFDGYIDFKKQTNKNQHVPIIVKKDRVFSLSSLRSPISMMPHTKADDVQQELQQRRNTRLNVRKMIQNRNRPLLKEVITREEKRAQDPSKVKEDKIPYNFKQHKAPNFDTILPQKRQDDQFNHQKETSNQNPKKHVRKTPENQRKGQNSGNISEQEKEVERKTMGLSSEKQQQVIRSRSRDKKEKKPRMNRDPLAEETPKPKKARAKKDPAAEKIPKPKKPREKKKVFKEEWSLREYSSSEVEDYKAVFDGDSVLFSNDRSMSSKQSYPSDSLEYFLKIVQYPDNNNPCL